MKKISAILLIVALTGGGCLLYGQKSNKGKRKNINTQEFFYCLHEASRLKMSGNTMEAVLNLTKAIEINPLSAAAHYELAGLYMHLGDLEKGLELAKKACKLNPQQEWYKILLAEIYKSNGNFKNAIKVFGELIAMFPENSEYYFQRADIFRYMKKYDKALKEYDAIEKKFGYSELISLDKEELWLLKGDENNALAEIEKLVKMFPNEPRYLGILAETYMNNQNYDEAYKYYSKMMETDSANGLLRLSLSEYYRLTKDFGRSFTEMKLAFASADVSLDTKVRMLSAMMTYVNASPELKEQVYSLIQILLEVHPDDARSHAFYADFLINDRQYEQARSELHIVLQTEKKQYLIWEQLLILDSQLNDYTALLKDSETSLEYFPGQPMVYYFKGLALYMMKRNEESLPVLTQGVEMVVNNKPLELQFYTVMAEAFNRAGQHASSDEYMGKALKLDPQNLMLLNNWAYYLSQRKEKLDKAEKMSLMTIEIESTNSTYLDTYAWILYQQNKLEKATEYIEKAIMWGGNTNAVIVEHYGDIMYKTGNTEKAQEQWEKAKTLGKGSALLEKKIIEKRLIEE